MKRNRGKILSIFLLFSSFFYTLDAKEEEYKWSAYINKKSAYVNEAIYLKYVCEFKDRGELYVIEFIPKSTKNFEIIALSQTHKVHNNKRIQTYKYVVFPKIAGHLSFDFNLEMKKTNQDSIKSTTLGRDNLQFEEYIIKVIRQKQLSIEVKRIDELLIGSFNLSIKKDELKIKAYEPYHLSIIIDGLGNMDAIKEISFTGLDAKVFSSEPKKDYKLTKDGLKGKWSQKFAFVGSENFTIPNIKIDYYDIHDAKSKTLSIKEIDVNVVPSYTQEELLDEVDDASLEFKIEYTYYLLTFIAGFLLAKVNFKAKDSQNYNSFDAKVRKSKTLEELHILLILQNSRKYNEIILDIETHKITSISEVKKLLII